MNPNPQPRPERLFRFFDPPGAQFLENRWLWFRPIGDQNDPFDAVPALGAMVRRAQGSAFQRKLWAGAITNQYFADLENWNREVEDDVHENYLRNTRGRFAIVAFTECLNRIPHWSFYGKDHKGFAVEFDPRHDFFDRLVQVKYTDHRPPVGAYASDSSLFDLIRTKSIDWKDEKEWRLTSQLQNLSNAKGPEGTGFTHYLEVPEDAFRGVSFGCRAEPQLKNRIRKFIKDWKLSKMEFSEMKPDLDHYKLNVVPARF